MKKVFVALGTVSDKPSSKGIQFKPTAGKQFGMANNYPVLQP